MPIDRGQFRFSILSSRPNISDRFFKLTTNFTHIQKFQKNGVFVVNCHEPPSWILGERRIPSMISRTFRSRIFHSCSHPASFLVCWLPFFTCNILDAISIKFSLNTAPGNFAFQVFPLIFPIIPPIPIYFPLSLFSSPMIRLSHPRSTSQATTLLGYLNSCLNPIIYTIFNPEFRKAFKRVLGLGH